MVPGSATNGRPRVSLGLPVRNGENYLAAALDSLLAQTFTDLEVLVSDNASEDRTAEICKRYAECDPRVAYTRNETNVGAARNYNLVFARARGDYFKWAAHDDLVDPTFVERCVEVLDADPEVVACYPRTRYVDEDGHEQRVSNGDLGLLDADPASRVRALVDREIEGDDILMSIFGMLRADTLRRTGLIGSYPAADQVLVLELALLGRFAQVPEPLFSRRMHALTSMAKNRTPHEQARWFDPGRRPRVVMPVWGLWRRHNAVIRRSRLRFPDRAGCYWQLARRFVRKPDALAGELKKAVFQLLGRR